MKIMMAMLTDYYYIIPRLDLKSLFIILISLQMETKWKNQRYPIS